MGAGGCVAVAAILAGVSVEASTVRGTITTIGRGSDTTILRMTDGGAAGIGAASLFAARAIPLAIPTERPTAAAVAASRLHRPAFSGFLEADLVTLFLLVVVILSVVPGVRRLGLRRLGLDYGRLGHSG